MTLNIEILVLGLVISGVAITLGYIINRRGEFLRIAGYVLLIIIGIVLLTDAIVFVDGDNVTGSFDYSVLNGSLVLNNSSYVIRTNYSSQKSTITNIFSFVIMILGFFGVVDTAREVNVKKKRLLEEDDNDVQDEIYGRDHN